MTVTDWIVAVAAVLGLVGGAVGFFRSGRAGRKADAATRTANAARQTAADATEEAAAALKRANDLVEEYAPRPSIKLTTSPAMEDIPFWSTQDDGSKLHFIAATVRLTVRNNGTAAAYDIHGRVPHGRMVVPEWADFGTIQPNSEESREFTITRVPGDPVEATVEWRYHPSPDTFSDDIEL